MYCFIMNPTASSGMGRRVWKKLKPILDARDVEYKLLVFNKIEKLVAFVNAATGGDITEETTKTLGKKSLNILQNASSIHIVVLGGDGTLNLVLNAIVDLNNTKLSCIRIGSGNDFARNNGIDKKPEKALLHLLDEPEELLLDYGEATYEDEVGQTTTKRFIISSGVGYDADICEEVSKSKLKKKLNKLYMGKLVYVAVGIKQIFSRKTTKVTLYMDDNNTVSVDRLFFSVGMIHKMEGGGVPFCPDADPTDGYLDICLASAAPIPKLLLEVLMVYRGKHILFSNIGQYRSRSVRVVTSEPQWIHMDGETPCRVRDVTLSCRQGLHFVK